MNNPGIISSSAEHSRHASTATAPNINNGICTGDKNQTLARTVGSVWAGSQMERNKSQLIVWDKMSNMCKKKKYMCKRVERCQREAVQQAALKGKKTNLTEATSSDSPAIMCSHNVKKGNLWEKVKIVIKVRINCVARWFKQYRDWSLRQSQFELHNQQN